jgi:GntR family transcriptional repressor for pyruvate dehydrogenase complex
MRFDSIDPPTAYQAAADQLRKAILESELSPGDTLPSERDLSQQLRVGRSTVREALRQLHAEGLVESPRRTSPMRIADPADKLPGLIVQVTKVRHLSLENLLEARRAIESRALELAARSPDSERLMFARKALEEMEHSATTAAEFHDSDFAFHLALVESAGHPLLGLLLRGIREAMRAHLISLLSKRLAPARSRLIQEHGRLLASIERGEVDRVADLLADHIEGFY